MMRVRLLTGAVLAWLYADAKATLALLYATIGTRSNFIAGILLQRVCFNGTGDRFSLRYPNITHAIAGIVVSERHTKGFDTGIANALRIKLPTYLVIAVNHHD